eukprot:288253-Chlamydomonas_euryale.AAC.2
MERLSGSCSPSAARMSSSAGASRLCLACIAMLPKSLLICGGNGGRASMCGVQVSRAAARLMPSTAVGTCPARPFRRVRMTLVPQSSTWWLLA